MASTQWQSKHKGILSNEVFQEIVHSDNDGAAMKRVPPNGDTATHPTNPGLMLSIRGMAERWLTSAVKQLAGFLLGVSTNQLPPCASDVVSSEPQSWWARAKVSPYYCPIVSAVPV